MFKKKVDIKKKVIINSIIIFLLGFITHNLYDWAPSFLTMIFPVNDSLYEHAKMIFITPIIFGIGWYLYLMYKNITTDNYFFSLLITIIANLSIFFAIYLPIYYRFGENMIVTLVIYFISIVISQIVNLAIMHNTKNNFLLNVLGIIMIVVSYGFFLYFTYYPLEKPFFFDPMNEVYGIYK